MNNLLNERQKLIVNHYEMILDSSPKIYLWDKGPYEKLPYDFRILEFPPTATKKMWTYATCCMSQPEDMQKIELHMYSPIKDESIIELLTALVYYHRKTDKIGLNHTVYFGRPWQKESTCTYGFVSLPYLDGPVLENLNSNNGIIKFYWLLPITEAEVRYKREYGVDALEQKFDNPSFNYVDPNRPSSV